MTSFTMMERNSLSKIKKQLKLTPTRSHNSSRCKTAGIILDKSSGKDSKNERGLKKYPTIIIERRAPVAVIEFNEEEALKKLNKIAEQIPDATKKASMKKYLKFAGEEMAVNNCTKDIQIKAKPMNGLEDISLCKNDELKHNEFRKEPKNKKNTKFCLQKFNNNNFNLIERQVEISKVFEDIKTHLEHLMASKSDQLKHYEGSLSEILKEVNTFCLDCRHLMSNLMYFRMTNLRKVLIQLFDLSLSSHCGPSFLEQILTLEQNLLVQVSPVRQSLSFTHKLETLQKEDRRLAVQQNVREYVRGVNLSIANLLNDHSDFDYCMFKGHANQLEMQLKQFKANFKEIEKEKHSLLNLLLEQLGSTIDACMSDDLLRLKMSKGFFDVLQNVRNDLLTCLNATKA